MSMICGNSGKVTVPSAINGRPVTEICAGAFRNSSAVTDIVIPDSVCRAGDGAHSSFSLK